MHRFPGHVLFGGRKLTVLPVLILHQLVVFTAQAGIVIIRSNSSAGNCKPHTFMAAKLTASGKTWFFATFLRGICYSWSHKQPFVEMMVRRYRMKRLVGLEGGGEDPSREGRFLFVATLVEKQIYGLVYAYTASSSISILAALTVHMGAQTICQEQRNAVLPLNLINIFINKAAVLSVSTPRMVF